MKLKSFPLALGLLATPSCKDPNGPFQGKECYVDFPFGTEEVFVQTERFAENYDLVMRQMDHYCEEVPDGEVTCVSIAPNGYEMNVVSSDCAGDQTSKVFSADFFDFLSPRMDARCYWGPVELLCQDY